MFKQNMLLQLILIIVVSHTFLSHTAYAQQTSIDPFVKIRESQKKQDWNQVVVDSEKLKPSLVDPIHIQMNYYILAQTYFNLGQFEKAKENIQPLLSQKSHLEEYYRYLAAEIYFKLNDFSAAQNELVLVLQSKPNYKLKFDSHFLLSQIYYAQKNYSKSLDNLNKIERSSRRESFYPDIVYEIAKSYQGLGKKPHFCKWVAKLYSKFPAYEKVSSWGINLSQNTFESKPTECFQTQEEKKQRIKNLQWSGLTEKARAEIDLYVEQLPAEQKFDGVKLKAQFLNHDGAVFEALTLLTPYYSAKKGDVNYLMLLGSAAARSGDASLAVGSFYSAYKLNPRSKASKSALFQSAMLSFQFQDYDGAQRKFKEYIQKYGGNLSQDAKWNLAWIQYLKGDYESSFKSLSQLKVMKGRKKRGITPDRIQYWMAMSLMKQGKKDKAKTIFEILSKDKLIGYYSVLAQYRLKQIEETQPVVARVSTSFTQRNQNLRSRFVASEILLPSVDESDFSDNLENEEIVNMAVDASADGDVESVEKSTEEEAEEAATQAEAVPVTGEGQAATEPTSDDKNPDLKHEEDIVFQNPLLIKRFEQARDLMMMGFDDIAKWDLFEIERHTRNRDYLKQLIKEYESVETYNRSSYIGQVTFGSQRAEHGIEGIRYLWESTYPKAYESYVLGFSKDYKVPREFVWSIMRAESNYKKDVRSQVGAQGLMQLMPYTADKIVQSLSLKNYSHSKLTEPEVAIQVGTKYLSHLLKKFEGNVPLAEASYNAGPHRTWLWLKSFGHLEMDEFVEHIPFAETRNYVKKVVSNFHIYSRLYAENKSPMGLITQPIQIKIPDVIPTRETWEDL